MGWKWLRMDISRSIRSLVHWSKIDLWWLSLYVEVKVIETSGWVSEVFRGLGLELLVVEGEEGAQIMSLVWLFWVYSCIENTHVEIFSSSIKVILVIALVVETSIVVVNIIIIFLLSGVLKPFLIYSWIYSALLIAWYRIGLSFYLSRFFTERCHITHFLFFPRLPCLLLLILSPPSSKRSLFRGQ